MEKTKTIYVAINNCYGGFPWELERVWNSPKEFQEAIEALHNLSDEEIDTDHDGIHPLSFSEVVLLEVTLSEDEEYRINEYDGMESLYFIKKGAITSSCKRVYPQ